MSSGSDGTPGPWCFEDESGYVAVRGKNGAGIFYESKWHVGAEADARLIAEAGTVLHETGLTPRQLAEQRAELLEALILMEREKSDYMLENKLGDPAKETTNKLARAAIANATQQRNATGGEG